MSSHEGDKMTPDSTRKLFLASNNPNPEPSRKKYRARLRIVARGKAA